MRHLLLILVLIFPVLGSAGVSISFDSDTYWPGQMINVKCSYTIDPESSSILQMDSSQLEDMHLPFASRRTGWGLFHVRKEELEAGKCKPVHAPLVPGNYVYEATWYSRRPDSKILATVPITVTPLPKSSDVLTFSRNYIDKQNGNPQAEFSLNIETERCYPTDLNSRLSYVLIVDRITEAIYSKTHYLEQRSEGKSGENPSNISEYHCLPSGHLLNTVTAPGPESPGNWMLVLATVDRDKKCRGKCTNLDDFSEANLNVIATAPYTSIGPEPPLNSDLSATEASLPAPSAEDVCKRGNGVFYGDPFTIRYAVPLSTANAEETRNFNNKGDSAPLDNETGNAPGIAGSGTNCTSSGTLKSYRCDEVTNGNVATDNSVKIEIDGGLDCSRYFELKSSGCDRVNNAEVAADASGKIEIDVGLDCSRYFELKSSGCDRVNNSEVAADASEKTEIDVGLDCSRYLELKSYGCDEIAEGNLATDNSSVPGMEIDAVELMITLRPVFTPGEPSTLNLQPAGLANFTRPERLTDDQIETASALFEKQMDLIEAWRQSMHENQMDAVLDQNAPELKIPLVDPGIEQRGPQPKLRLAMSCGSIFETRAKLASLYKKRDSKLKNIKRLEDYISRNKGLLWDSKAVNSAQDKLAIEELELTQLNSAIDEKEAYVAKRNTVLNEENRDRNIAAIKKDTDRMAAEEARRRNEMIAAGKDVARYRMELIQGENEYVKQLAVLEAAGKAAEERGMRELRDTIGADWNRLHTARNHWRSSKQSMLEFRRREEDRLRQQNSRDGIGPTESAYELLIKEGVNPNQVLYAGAEEAGQRGVLQAQNDARTLGGTSTKEYHIEDLGRDFAATNRKAALDPEILVKRYAAFGKGAARATADAVRDVVEVGIKAGQIAGETAEYYYEKAKNEEYDTFGDANLQAIAVGIGSVAKLDAAQIRDKAVETAEQIADAANRKFGQMSARGEAGLLEGLEMAGYTTASIMSAEEVVLRSFIKAAKPVGNSSDYLLANRATDKPKSFTESADPFGEKNNPLIVDADEHFRPIPEGDIETRIVPGGDEYLITRKMKGPGEIEQKLDMDVPYETFIDRTSNPEFSKDLTKDLRHLDDPKGIYIVGENNSPVIIDVETGLPLHYLHHKMGKGGMSSIYRGTGTGKNKRITRVTSFDPDNPVEAIVEEVGGIIGRNIEKESEYFRFTKTIEPPIVVTKPGEPNKKFLVTVEENIESLDHGNLVSNAEQRFSKRDPTPGEIATMNIAIREMNRKGVVWADHKMKNFDIVPAETKTGYKLVIFDKGGFYPAVGRNAKERHENARHAQNVFDRTPTKNDRYGYGVNRYIHEDTKVSRLLDTSIYGNAEIGQVLAYSPGNINRGKNRKFKYLELGMLSPEEFENYLQATLNKEIRLPPVSPDK